MAKARHPVTRRGGLLVKLLGTVTIVTVALAASILILRLIFSLPALDGGATSTAISASEGTMLGGAFRDAIDSHSGLSGVRPLVSGPEAFATRVALARRAEASIDAQYYIWQDDATGLLLLDELRQAALRGVRVRLLLDDNGILGLDAELAGLDALETAEVRLWNPFVLRSPKVLNYVWDFPRLNRRMHNKSFTVDGITTVVGGRNVGDVYFAYGERHYVDLDALAVGPAAAAAAAEFDRYWTSGSAYPAALILAPAPDGLESLEERATTAQGAPEAAAYAEAVTVTPLMQAVEARADLFEWVPVMVLSDDPAKGLGEAERSGLLLTRLLGEVGRPVRNVDIVSAYFVPGTGEAGGARVLAELEGQGVAVRVLTNAWEATDVPLVHAGYLRSRGTLLDAGVELLELRAEAAPVDAASGVDLASAGLLGSSAASLHAKTMAFDRTRIFVGSFNLDQRSEHLNTEMGMLIDSPAIAGELARMMDGVTPGAAYRVERAADGTTVWVAGELGGTEAPLSPEPGTTRLQRLGLTIASWMPIEWML